MQIPTPKPPPIDTTAQDNINKLLRPGSVDTTEPIIGADDLKEAPEEVKKWLLGQTRIAPTAVSKVISDVTNKMGVYVSYIVVQRLSKLQRVVDYLHAIEDRLYDNKEAVATMEQAQLKSEYARVNDQVNEILEFTRKFAVQSKDLISDPDRDELANLIRSLEPESVRQLKEEIQTLMRRTKKVEPKE